MIQAGGQDQLIVNSTNRLEGLDPANGKVLWHAGGEVKVPVPTPVYHNGVLYLNRGYTSSPYLAVRPGGKIEWEVNTGGPYVSSLTYYDGLLYLANERGIASVVDAANGETLWRERLGSLFSASPVAANGYIYLVNEEGDTFVLKAGREKHVVAKNSLGERTLASPAISRGQIFLRTDDSLYCIGKK